VLCDEVPALLNQKPRYPVSTTMPVSFISWALRAGHLREEPKAAGGGAPHRLPRSKQLATSSSSSSCGSMPAVSLGLPRAAGVEWLQKQRQWSAKEARRVRRPLLSELQVPEWQELAVGSGPAEAGGCVEDRPVPQAHGVGLSAQRHCGAGQRKGGAYQNGR
jgi:hypothetical protein